MNDNYWSEKNKVKVSSKLPQCSANNYYKPNITSVLTKISIDEEYFLPKYSNSNSSSADLFANIPEKESIGICSFGTEIIDCGFSIQIENGYKACISIDSYWCDKGLIIMGSNQIDPQDDCRIKINVMNIGKKILVVSHKDKIGKIWIEPIYFFEWTKT